MSEYYVSVRKEFKNNIQKLVLNTLKENIFISVFIIYSFSMTINAQDIIPINSIILNDSKLSIIGASNVTDFECLYEDDFQTNTLSHFFTLENKVVRVSGDTLKLAIDNFDCGRRGINRDFRKSLKSNEYPSIDISLIDFESSNKLLERVNVLISLAGNERKYALEFKSTYQDEDIIEIQGEQKLSMTDFNIDPPTALLGLIKVRDELTIKFTLFLKTL